MTTDLRQLVVAVAAQVRERLVDSIEIYDFECDSDLSGMCAIASIALAKSFARHGLDYRIAEGFWRSERHCWLISHDLLVDVTLQQFDPMAEAVHVEPWDKAEHHFAIKLWDSIQDAEESTWVSEVALDWADFVVTPKVAWV